MRRPTSEGEAAGGGVGGGGGGRVVSACWKQLRKMVTSISIFCSLSCPPSPPPSSVSFISLCLSLPFSFFCVFWFYVYSFIKLCLPPSIHQSIHPKIIHPLRRISSNKIGNITLFFSYFSESPYVLQSDHHRPLLSRRTSLSSLTHSQS